MLWEVDDAGTRYITDTGWDIIENQKQVPGGGLAGDAMGIVNFEMYTGQTINPLSKMPFNHAQWESSKEHALESNKIMQQWADDHDAVDLLEYATDNNMTIKGIPPLKMMPPMPSDIETLSSQVGDVIKTYSWKMVFAKDEAEFESLWNDMKDKAFGLGMQDILDWVLPTFEETKAQYEQYMK